MKRCYLMALLLGCALSTVSARGLLQAGSNSSYCGSVEAAYKDICCAGAQEAGTYDPSCPSSATDQCAAQAEPYFASCCADKAQNGQYDPSCPLGDSCATWAPPHRKQCCGVKAANNITDTICYALTACGDWAMPEQYADCCVGKTAAAEYDETCPVVAGECITYAPGADQDKCCADKQAAGLYDPACPITDACSSYPPQNRYTCCQAKASKNQSDGACATAEMAGMDCSSWSPADVPYCCAVKAAQKVFDALCPAPEVCKFPCGDSCILSLPEVTNNNNKYLLGYTADSAKAAADAFCRYKGYGSAGAYKPLTVPAQFVAGAGAWATYNLVTKEACSGPQCTAIGVVECVKQGATPLVKDAAGNVGCANSGINNIGSHNSGSNVRGNDNSGSNVWGDSNSGNSGSNVIGTNNGPFTL
ncbi:hypothetical protein N2152v2_007006 [Parachlorella kessleri]